MSPILVGHLYTPHVSHLFGSFLYHIPSQDIRKLFSLSQIFINDPWSWSLPPVVWAATTSIWQLIRGCQSCSSESGWTDPPTLAATACFSPTPVLNYPPTLTTTQCTEHLIVLQVPLGHMIESTSFVPLGTLSRAISWFWHYLECINENPVEYLTAWIYLCIGYIHSCKCCKIAYIVGLLLPPPPWQGHKQFGGCKAFLLYLFMLFT